MVESKLTEAKLDHGKVGVLEQGCAVMKELDGDQQCGRKLSTGSHLMSSSLLLLRPSNTPTKIASARQQLLQSNNGRRHDIVQLQ